MDAETEAEKERIRLWSEKFNIDDLEHKVTIGAGSFGQVILVKHRQTGKVYALKVLPIAHVIRLKQVDHVKQEKEVLQQLDHPFIVNLVWSHHDLRLLYMMFEYVCGGELYAYLHRHKQFSDDVCRFYTSEIALAFEYMHKKRIAYRDLKPENLLLDRRGHIKIADFGFAKTVEDRTYTFCGTPEYVAPEIVQNSGHGTAVDWWALGILVYEMLTGDAPFVGETNEKTWEKILKGSISWPPQIKTDAKDIITRFLTKDPTSRLGNMKRQALDVKEHPWFRGIVWTEVYDRKLKPPFVPQVDTDEDTRNFSSYEETNWLESQKRVANAMLLFYNF